MEARTYRSEGAIARYRLRTPWRRVVTLGLAEVGSAVLLAWIARIGVDWVLFVTHGPAKPRWLLYAFGLFPFAAAVAWLRQLRRLLVREGTTLVVYRDRLSLEAPARTARTMPLDAPALVRELSMAVFADPQDAHRLSALVEELRAGKSAAVVPPEDAREDGASRKKEVRDELDARLDEELARMPDRRG